MIWNVVGAVIFGFCLGLLIYLLKTRLYFPNYAVIDPPVPTKSHERIIYLACPYSKYGVKKRDEAFRKVTKAASGLIRQGYVVFSPISHTHHMDKALRSLNLPSTFWCNQDQPFMELCTDMAILPLDGWEESEGVKAEREYFEAQGKPVWFVRS